MALTRSSVKAPRRVTELPRLGWRFAPVVAAIVSLLLLQVYFLEPMYVLVFSSACVFTAVLGVLCGKLSIPGPIFGKWAVLTTAVLLISSLMNRVDLVSTVGSWALLFIPIAVSLAIIAFRPDTSILHRLIEINAFCAILQFVVICVQSYQAGEIIFEDGVAGTISRRGVNSHTPGVVMMINCLLYAFLWYSSRRSLYSVASILSLCFWILTSTAHSYIAFVCGTILFVLLRKVSIPMLLKIAVVLWCFASLVEQSQNAVYKQLSSHSRDLLAGEMGQFRIIGKYKLYANTVDLFDEMEYPLIGVGPGMYNSRVAYAKKGDYLTWGYFKKARYSFMPPESPYTRKYVHTPVIVNKYGGGVRNNPLTSIISVLAEYGFLGFTLFLTFGLSVYRMLGSLASAGNKDFRAIAMGLQLISLIFLFMIFFEGWLEVPKAMILYWAFLAVCVVGQRQTGRTDHRYSVPAPA
jgi:hypothetical protein